MKAIQLANGYTEAYGIWPMLAVMALSGALLLCNAAAARFFVRHITGPIRAMPGYDGFREVNKSRAWLLFVRVIIGLWAAGVFVASFLAMVGWLPED